MERKNDMVKISMASDWKLWCVKQIGVWMMCDVCTTRLTDVLGDTDIS